MAMFDKLGEDVGVVSKTQLHHLGTIWEGLYAQDGGWYARVAYVRFNAPVEANRVVLIGQKPYGQLSEGSNPARNYRSFNVNGPATIEAAAAKMHVSGGGQSSFAGITVASVPVATEGEPRFGFVVVSGNARLSLEPAEAVPIVVNAPLALKADASAGTVAAFIADTTAYRVNAFSASAKSSTTPDVNQVFIPQSLLTVDRLPVT